MDRFNKFKVIRNKYDEYFKERLGEGKLPMRSTDYGFWGTASLVNLYEFFRRINLEDYDFFLDLGSGDGRAVLVASLFTKAVGIEGDEQLVEVSEKLKEELALEADFYQGNFLKHDFSKYDCIFIYPDKAFSKEFQKKIKEEFTGDFFVYNKIYKPYDLPQGRTIWVDQMPIMRFKI